jgi:thiol-disulfide isomerase/thioredoxin
MRLSFYIRFLCLVLIAAFAVPQSAFAVGELRPWTGGATPPLALNDLNGRPHRLADYHDKVVVINFWATWCEPCRDEIPSLQRLKDQLAGKAFGLIAVNMGEGAPRVHRFLDMMPIDYAILLDSDMRATKAWQAHMLPYSFVLDRAHRIRYTVVGEIDWSAPDVVRRIEALTH